jgi:hypothetical protein
LPINAKIIIDTGMENVATRVDQKGFMLCFAKIAVAIVVFFHKK